MADERTEPTRAEQMADVARAEELLDPGAASLMLKLMLHNAEDRCSTLQMIVDGQTAEIARKDVEIAELQERLHLAWEQIDALEQDAGYLADVSYY